MFAEVVVAVIAEITGREPMFGDGEGAVKCRKERSVLFSIPIYPLLILCSDESLG